MSKKIKDVVKCPKCKKGVTVNYDKHPNRKTFMCPFCGQEIKQKVVDNKWTPNAEWHQGKHKSTPFTVEKAREALKRGFGKISGTFKEEVSAKPNLKPRVVRK